MADFVAESLSNREYKYGFVTDIETEDFPKGLDEKIIHQLSEKKNDPEFIRNLRMKAFKHWQTLKEPHWAHLTYPELNYQDMRYYSAPKQKTDGPKNLDEI